MNAAQVVYEPLMYLNCIFEVYLLYNFLDAIFPLNDNKQFRRLFKIVGGATAIYIVNSFKQPSLNLVFVPIILIVFTWLMFEIEFKYNFLYVIFYYVILAVSEFAFHYVYALAGIDVTKVDFSRVFFLIVEKVFEFTVVQIIKKRHQNSYQSDSYQYLKSLFILPIASMILLNGFFIPIKDPFGSLLVLVGGIMLVVSNIVNFSIVEKLLTAVYTAKDAEMFRLKTQLEQNHYQRLEEVNKECADSIHELKRMVRTMEQLASTNDFDAVKLVATEISEKGFSINARIYSGDKITNAIFIEREKMALDMGVRYSVEVQCGIDLEFISNVDKISMFGNLLDNALEAAAGSECGYVCVSLFMGNDAFLIFKVVNNFRVKPKKRGKVYLTIKQDKGRHGFGIKKVEELAQKYGGMLNISEDQNVFNAVLLLSNIPKMES